jgi:hypothetical protein
VVYAVPGESKVLVHFNNRLTPSLVDLTDAVLALRVLAGLPTWPAMYDGEDVDGDGAIGLAEAVFALQSAAEMR